MLDVSNPLKNVVQQRIASAMSKCCNIMYNTYLKMKIGGGEEGPIEEEFFCKLTMTQPSSMGAAESLDDEEYYVQLALLAKAGELFSNKSFKKVC